jgi:hypothetical protein
MSLPLPIIHITNFLSAQGVEMSISESQKLEAFYEEQLPVKTSLLGGLFVRFKKLLQEETMATGLVKCLKSDTDWVDMPTYTAYWEDHKLFDALSNYYGNLYRGSYVFNYLMGALAVLLALIPIGFEIEHEYGLVFSALELATILMVLVIHKIGASPQKDTCLRSFAGIKLNRRWHEKWIEYRILAERFRYIEILYPNPIGINLRTQGETRNNELSNWINAYYSARISLENTECQTDLITYKDRLTLIMKGQGSYHHKSALKYEHIHHRLHSFASWLFYGTLAACYMHFFWHNPILTLIAGFFPAVAGAMHSILASGEFSKSAQVSERIHIHISTLLDRLEVANDTAQIRDIAIDFHNIVIREAMSWRAMFKDKNVPLA